MNKYRVFKNRKFNPEYDFEGRCVKCHKRLNLLITASGQHSVRLDVIKCKLHPEDSHILYGQRDDIERADGGHLYVQEFKKIMKEMRKRRK
jgi:hypothetical protein